jgi:phosphoribosyl 1,2-cyclic phosphate phosphodiesterase
MPVMGFRVGNFSYITDAKEIPSDTIDKVKGSEVLVLNALQKEPHISHFNLDEAVTMAKEIGATTTYFTHISHKLGLHSKIEKELPPSIRLAYDGLEIVV